MIRSRDVNKELKRVDDLVKDEGATDKAVQKAILKTLSIIAKLVRDVRTNQVLALEANKVELIKEERKDEKETETK